MFFDAVPPPKMNRDTEDGDWNITGSPTSRLPATVICVIVLFLIIFVLWPSKAKQSETIAAPQVTELRQVLQKISDHDKMIGDKARALDRLESSARGATEEVNQYYQLLSEVHWLKKMRAEYANNYNGMVRNLSDRDKISLTELRKVGLPTGIR